ncbi:MAG: hypothetical protein PHH60_05980, partial [Candidatus Margulisbacteria bacterium]|nr:hypothetical protein [Candidatus Margulisiibacteriota bacterium]
MKKGLWLFLLLLFLTVVARADVNFYLDPSHLGVGARPLGMGKAFIGMSHDVNAIFINPASLANLEDWGVT